MIILITFISAYIFLYLAGLLDSIKAYSKAYRKKKLEDQGLIYNKDFTYEDIRYKIFSHKYYWYLVPHSLGLILCYLFFSYTGQWQIFISYILMTHLEDKAYYFWQSQYKVCAKKGLPSALPWLINDAPKFIQPFFIWIFRGKEVLKQDFEITLQYEQSTSALVTVILYLLT